MVRKDDILGKVRVAAPCQMNWDWMEGDDRTRFCSACNLNVYNLSAISRKDAEALVTSNEGRLCIRYYQRRDGTIITQNCPVGLQTVRKRIATTAACALTMLLSLVVFATRRAGDEFSAQDEYALQSIQERVRQSYPVQTMVKWIDPEDHVQGRRIMLGAMAGPSIHSGQTSLQQSP